MTAKKMELICPHCGSLESVSLVPNNQVRFDCGFVCILTNGMLKELFKSAGGER